MEYRLASGDAEHGASCELGVTAIEYALIAALIALAIIAGAGLLGTELGGAYDFVAAQMDAVM